MSVTGDRAVVALRGRDGGPAHPASRDTVCYRTGNPAEFGRTPAVAGLLRNGGSLCTAWRVGPDNRVLTNNHCFTGGAGIEVWFNHDCTTCGGSTSATVTKVLVSQVPRTSAARDYTLFRVTDFGSLASFGYLELDARVPAVGEEVYVIGHPAGELEKLSLRDDQNGGGYCVVSAVRVNGSSSQSDIAYRCDTEGGSSGSPVRVPAHEQGHRPAPLRRLPEPGRPDRPRRGADRRPAVGRSRPCSRSRGAWTRPGLSDLRPGTSKA